MSRTARSMVAFRWQLVRNIASEARAVERVRESLNCFPCYLGFLPVIRTYFPVMAKIVPC
jgi:hypothetical protein